MSQRCAIDEARREREASEAIETEETVEILSAAEPAEPARPRRRRPRRALRWLIAAVAVVVALGGVYAVYAAKSGAAAAGKGAAHGSDKAAGDEKAEPAPIPVETAEVHQRSVASYISATANLVPENEVEVLAESEGRLAHLEVDEGQRVEKGQVLAELAQGDTPMALEKAKVRLENAKLEFDRTAKLADEGLVSGADRDQSVMELGVAKQELAEAQWHLEKTLIRAPFGGQVTKRSTQVGQDVRLGDELFTVASFDPLVARIYLAETDVLALDRGRPVRIVLKADEDVAFDGKIRQIAPVVDTATGTVKVTVEAIRPPAQVRPGSFVRVDVVKERRPDALVVPKVALVREAPEDLRLRGRGRRRPQARGDDGDRGGPGGRGRLGPRRRGAGDRRRPGGAQGRLAGQGPRSHQDRRHNLTRPLNLRVWEGASPSPLEGGKGSEGMRG